jgi:hypothetical protein
VRRSCHVRRDSIVPPKTQSSRGNDPSKFVR